MSESSEAAKLPVASWESSVKKTADLQLPTDNLATAIQLQPVYDQ